MLPISEKEFKAMTKKDEDNGKYYQVENGHAFFYTGRVVHRVTNFSTMEDGLYKFGETSTISAYLIAPWLIQKPVFPHSIELKFEIVERIHKLARQLLSIRVDKEDIPYVNMKFEQIGNSQTILIKLEIEGNGSFPNSEFSFAQTLRLGIDEYSDWDFAFNLLELADMLKPFAKLGIDSDYIKMEYGDEQDGKVWISYSHNGHDLLAATPYERPVKKEEKGTEKSDADDTTISLDGGKPVSMSQFKSAVQKAVNHAWNESDTEEEHWDDEEDFDVSEDDPAYLDEEKSPLTTLGPDLVAGVHYDVAGPDPESEAGRSWLPPPKDNIISLHGEHVTALTEV